jgi:class 3 adenylate cyclase
MSLGLLVAESVDLATILLTDLVGSTRLANSVGPVRGDQLREEHFGLLRDAIASSRGKEVKNTGDGLMVAFPSASEAVRCAVAMHQLFERRYRDPEQAMHLRIGLGAGESTVKDGDYFGVPTIEAARLCAQAPSDGILISATVKLLAGRCDGIEFSSIGELKLKGFEEPVQAFSVSWAPLGEQTEASSRWPLPALLRSVPVVSYVGRAEERATLEEAVTLARDGARQVVLLSGEPGIGKTRLASYAARDAHSGGFAVAWGVCTEELAVPMSRGSGSAHTWSSTLRRTCSSAMSSATPESSPAWHETWAGESPICRPPRALTPRPSAICCSTLSPACWPRPQRQCHCVWCSTISTGQTRSRWHCSSTCCAPMSRALCR